MPTPSRQARIAVIESYLASGQPQKLFCQQEQIAYSTFQYWLKKYRQANTDTRGDDQSNPEFVPLHFASPMPAEQGQHFSIEYRNGVVLHINRPIEASLLMQLIRAQD